MNVALHGLEEAAGVRYQTAGVHAGDTKPGSPIVVRYADDLVVLCRTQQQAERVKVQLAGWLASRGLAFNEDKTKIVHLSDGFDFLGYNVRRYRQKLLIKPSEAAVRRIRKRLATEMRALRGSNVMAVLAKLGPIVRGSPGVLSMSHDVAPEHPTESFCNTSRGCGARCRRCSEARPARTCHMHDNLTGRRRADYAAATCTIRPYARFAPVCPPEKRGWMAYFRLADAERTFASLDGWLRRRLRQVRWKEWKTTAAKRHNLRIRGISESNARKWAGSSKGYWRVAGSKILQVSLPNSYWDRLGLKTLSQTWQRLNRTA